MAPPSDGNTPEASTRWRASWWRPDASTTVGTFQAIAVNTLVMAVLSPWIAIRLVNLRKWLLAVILLEIPIQIDVYLNYQEEAAFLGAVGGFNLSVTTICLGLLYALWLSDIWSRRILPPRHLLGVTSLAAAYLVMVVLSLAVAKDFSLALFELSILLQAFLLYLYLVSMIRSREDVLFVVTFLLIGLILQGAIMIGLRFIGHSLTVATVTARIDPSTRVGGTIGSPISAASYLELLLAPIFSLMFCQVTRIYKWLAGFGFTLGGVALVFTLSRGGWLAFLLSLVTLTFLLWWQGSFSIRIPLSIASIVAVLILLFHEPILKRLSEDDDRSAYSRVPLMELAGAIIKDHSFFGVGANNFISVMHSYISGDVRGEWLHPVHNKYLLVWSETGLFALLFFLGFLVATIRNGWQVWKQADPFLAPLALGFTSAVVGHMLHMSVDMFSSRPQVQMLWLVAGLITALHQIAPKGAPPSSWQAAQ